LHSSLPGTTSPNSKPPNCFGRRVLCVGVRFPNLFGCLPVFGLRLGENEPNIFDAGLEVGIGFGAKVAGAKLDWKGLLEGAAVGRGWGLGAKVDWKGLLEPNKLDAGLEVGIGLGEKVAGAKVDGKGLLLGASVGLG
jgi:hypothetical protein